MTTLYVVTSGVDQLSVSGRHVKPITDELLFSVQHRTTGGKRSVILSRQVVQELVIALQDWLAIGWSGVPVVDALVVEEE
jgi:hypothetical protein